MKNLVSVFIVIVILLGAIPLAFVIHSVKASLQVHNVDTGLDYVTIQEAIDAPETLNGHTIQADAATYLENVVVAKSLTICGSSGPAVTTVKANAAGPVFDVRTSYVTIMNFSITNGTNLPTDYYGAGIYLRGVTHCNVSNNIIYGNHGYTGAPGIYLSTSHYNDIVNNTIRDNDMHGIHVFDESPVFIPPPGEYGSHYNSIRQNTITGNLAGIYLFGSHNNITHNYIYSNAYEGISSRDSVDNKIEGNNITQNGMAGINIGLCYYFVIRNNEISRTTSTAGWSAVALGTSNNNIVSGNIIKENDYSGIYIFTYYVHDGIGEPSLDNEIYDNTLIMNEYGVKIDGRYPLPHTGNRIYHNNFAGNTINAVDPWSNIWDDGYPSGGNHWCNYTGVDLKSGPYQNETGSDGIGDTPHVIDGDSQDNYPLMEPWNAPFLHDVSVENIVPFKSVVPSGTDVDIRVTARNQGYCTETFNVTLYANMTEIGTISDVTMPRLSFHYLYFKWNTSEWDLGNYTISANVTRVLGESDIEDNTCEDGTVRIRPLFHDVAVTSVITSKAGCSPMETVGEGHLVRVYVTAENQGDFPETFNVTVYAGTAKTETKEVTLPSQDSTTIEFFWNTIGFAKGNYTISANATSVPDETEIGDNAQLGGQMLVTIPGDVDGDRDVDIFDIVRMAGGYGTKPPNPKYDPNCDIDGDADIDIFDLVRAAGNYGKSW